MYAAISNRKVKPRRFCLIRLLFTYSSCKWKFVFVVCPFVYEEKPGSYLFAYELNGLSHLCQLAFPLRTDS